jgi:hypothetical protein
METEQPGNRYQEATQDFLKARTPLELVALAAVALLVIDLLVLDIRTTTLLLIGIATLPWWLPYLKAYLREEGEPPAGPSHEEVDVPEEESDDTDQYGA